MTEAPARRVIFGTTQERKLFPLFYPPNRLGNQVTRPEAPLLGPGRYDNHEFGTILYNLQKTPGSTRGYSLSARTAARFPPCSKTVTPSPDKYQPDQSKSRVPPPGKTPFSSSARRFDGRTPSAEDGPGPGTYTLEATTNKKVEWPMRFGRPDWAKLPQLEKKSIRVKLDSEKEFLKHRGRVAYLSLYY